MAKMTIKDIAKLANVSVATISRYINGQNERMSQATAQRIAKIIAEHDFIPNKAAQRLKMNKTGLVGIVIANIDDNFATELFNGADAILQTAGYDAILVNTSDSLERETTQIDKLRHQQIDGLILQPLINQTVHYQKLVAQALPIILVDRYTRPELWPAVTTNNFEIGAKLAQLIVSKNYKQVIIYTEDPEYVTSRHERLCGLESILNKNALKVTVKKMSATNFKQAQNYNELKEVTNNFKVKTAIIALKEELLIQLIALCNFYEIKYPLHIGITGFSDSPMLNVLSPNLTTVRQGPYGIGAIAAELLIKELNQEKILKQRYEHPAKIDIHSSL